MSFSSITFLIFMVAVFILYWILPHPCRWVALLAANVVFYASFETRFLLLFFFLIVLSYGGAILMEKNRKIAKGVLITLIVLIAGSLAFFKYADFAITSVSKIASYFAIPFTSASLHLLQPVGISFFSFQMIGYLSDVYRGKVSAYRHFGKYAVFASFFANITSGPIERADHFLPQLDEEKTFDYERIVYGATLLLIGLVKKIVIADTVAKYVDSVFNHLDLSAGASVLIATLLFTLQIYCDFSGYSDMAVGLAKLLGFDLIINFRQPYFSRSIKAFWATWHISLSTWLRDYIYIPLGGNRKGTVRRNINLIVTFLISGLWHGANWTYVLWGLIHGVAQVIENTVYRKSAAPKAGLLQADAGTGRAKVVLQWFVTFLIVCIAWIFFRANSIKDAVYAVTHLVRAGSVDRTLLSLGMSAKAVIKVVCMAAGLWAYDFFSRRTDLILLLRRQKWPLRWVLYTVFAVLVIVLKIHNGTNASFIYFQF